MNQQTIYIQYILLAVWNYGMFISLVGNTKLLNSKPARHEWELLFNDSYIEPVLKTLEKNMSKAMDLVANDDKQGLFQNHDYMKSMFLDLCLN